MRILLLAAIVLVAACGGSSPTSPSSNARTSVNFRLDSNSCGRIFGSQTLNIGFFVDGLQVGSANLGIGTTSPSYTVSPGSHVASANVTNSTFRWSNIDFSVTAGSTFTGVLLC